MKLPYKVVMINLAAVVLPALVLWAQDGFLGNTGFFLYGLFGIIAGIINLLFALGFVLAGSKKSSLIQGFLISGLLFLITGFFSMTQVGFGR